MSKEKYLEELSNELHISKPMLKRYIYSVGTNKENIIDYARNSCCAIIRKDNGFDISYSAKMLNDKDQKISDLEAKLAESEKKVVISNNLRKNSDEVLLNYKTKKYGLDKTIQELRKMKLSLPEKEWYYKGFENCERQMSSHIADLTLEIKELKQQLAEKDKELDKYAELFGMKDKDFYVIEKTQYDKMKQGAKDIMREFTIEKLEQVKGNYQAYDGIELVGFIEQLIVEIKGLADENS